MDRLALITTAVRPIKKLFILEDGDLDRFAAIVRLCSQEIAGITNILLLNTPELFGDHVSHFVRHHDPDLILNYSSASSAELERHFQIDAYSSPTFDDVRRYASTPVVIWDNIPSPMSRYFESERRTVVSVIADEHDPVDLFSILHFGIVPPTFPEALETTIFKDLRFVDFDQRDTGALHDHDRNWVYLTLLISLTMEHGWSRYEQNKNPNSYFCNIPTIVLGSYSNLGSMIYFWNSRAAYPFNRTLWLPIELIEAPYLNLAPYSSVVITDHNSENDQRIKSLVNGRQLIDSSRYYFPAHTNRWTSFEHSATAPIACSKIRVEHPSHKTFSSRGINMDVALEIRGLDEVLAPPSVAIGRLFTKGDDHNPLGFRRIGLRGFSTRIRQFDLLRDAPLHEDLQLPDDYSIIEAIFHGFGYQTERTKITKLVEQLLRLIGGYDSIEMLASELSWHLIKQLAPKRTERIADEVRKELQSLQGATYRELAACLRSVPALSQPPTQTLKQLEGRLRVAAADRGTFHSVVQRFYDKGLLLRGKSVQCSHCGSKLWFPLESIVRPLRCYCCNLTLALPVAPEAEAQDSYRLNELLVQAVDQGLIAVLLTMRVLWEQRYLGSRLIPSLSIFKPEDGATKLESDIVFTLGTNLGLCEVKTEQSFDFEQADELSQLAKASRADLIVFSTLRADTEEEIVEFARHLDGANLQIPALIVTRNMLFASKVPQLSDAYRKEHLLEGAKEVFLF